MIRKRLLDAFNIEPSEIRSVSLLLVHSLFIGIFYGAFDISAHTLFLNSFDEAFIAKAYSISGIAGIILTFLYSKFQQKIPFKSLSILSVFFLSVITIGLWFSYKFFGTSKELIFITFILLGPLNIVAIVNFWGVVGRLFTLRQGKRLFGLIGSGQIFGTILISYFIPLISALKLNIKTEDLILIAGISLSLAAISQYVLTTLVDFKETAKSEQTGKAKHRFRKLLAQDKYIQTMVAYVVLSMIILFFVAFTFLASAQKQYPEEQDMKSFLGIFSGTMMIFGFLLKTLVYSKLMKNYGLRVGLLILPAILLIFSLLIIIVFNSASSTFILIFLLLSLNRLFSMSIRDAIEIPAFKTLYQSLSPNYRHEVQSKIDGTVNELSALSAGLILMGLGYFVTLISYIYILVFLIILWIFVGIRLYRQYKLSLHSTLINFESNLLDSTHNSVSHNLPINTRKRNLKLLSINNPLKYEREIIRNIKISDIKNLLTILEQVKTQTNFFAIPFLEKLPIENLDSTLVLRIQETTYFLKNKLPEANSANNLMHILKSDNKEKIILLAKFLRYKTDRIYQPILLNLLRNLNYEIKKEAIITAAYYPQDEIIRFLIEELHSDVYRLYARNSLIDIGERTTPFLIADFQKFLDRPKELVEIVSLLNEIKPLDSIPFLISNFNFYHRKIASAIIKILIELDVQLPEQKFREFQQAIEQKAQLYAWNLEALRKAQTENMPDYLINSLEKEVYTAYINFFDLLALRYDKNSIFQIRKNISSGNTEEIGFAIELMDLFIDEELKPIIFPLLDEIPAQEKTLILSEFFTISIMDNPLFISLLGRGANYLSKWSILCTLMAIYEKKVELSPNVIAAHVYNPNKTLSDTAILVLSRLFPEYYEKLIQKFSFAEKMRLTNQIEMANNFPLSISFNLTLFFKKIFINFNFSESDLLKWVENSEYKAVKEDITLSFNKYDQKIYIFLIKGDILFYREAIKLTNLNKLGKGILLNLENLNEITYIELKAFTEVLIFNYKNIKKLSALNTAFFEFIELSEKI